MVEVLALEDDPRPTGMLGEARHLGDDARAPGVGAVESIELGEEVGVDHGLLAGFVEFLEGGDEGLGDIAAAEGTETTRYAVRGHHVVVIWGGGRGGHRIGHRRPRLPAVIIARAPSLGS